MSSFPVRSARARWLVAGIVILLLAFAWYWGSPRWTLYQIRSAAEAGDTDKVAGYVDFPALRTSMKEQLKAKMAAEVAKSEGLGALGAMMGVAMVDSMVDGIITPSGLRALFAANKADASKKGIAKIDASSRDLQIYRTGLDRFSLRKPSDPSDGGLVFTRHGLGWKLSDMRMTD